MPTAGWTGILAPARQLWFQPVRASAPERIVLHADTVTENLRIGTAVGNIQAIDPNEFDRHRFTLAEGDGDEGNSSFYIDEGTLRTAVPIDREERASYSIRIQTTDLGGLQVERVFTLEVIAQTESPPAHGTIDLSFSPDGVIDGPVNALAQQADGKVLIGGDFTMIHGNTRQAFARLRADGAFDPAFGISGSSSFGTPVNGIDVQSDGKVLLGGGFSARGRPAGVWLV